jgi:hypothetical protein
MTDSSSQFTLEVDEGFFLIVGDDVTVYEDYDDAVAEVQEKIAGESETFLAQVTIENGDTDDIAVAVEQVSWQQVIQDMAEA